MRPEELTWKIVEECTDPWALLKEMGVEPVAHITEKGVKLTWWMGSKLASGRFETLEEGCRAAMKMLVDTYAPKGRQR